VPLHKLTIVRRPFKQSFTAVPAQSFTYKCILYTCVPYYCNVMSQHVHERVRSNWYQRVMVHMHSLPWCANQLVLPYCNMAYCITGRAGCCRPRVSVPRRHARVKDNPSRTRTALQATLLASYGIPCTGRGGLWLSGPESGRRRAWQSFPAGPFCSTIVAATTPSNNLPTWLPRLTRGGCTTVSPRNSSNTSAASASTARRCPPPSRACSSPETDGMTDWLTD
jgi:hypothetical protein